ncbi:hypothetical protein [Fredinandcohnia sp. 179-A 10B2 NHS]
MNLQIDVYSCEECGQAFCVEKDVEPLLTPCCMSELFEYSHTGEVVSTNE